MIDYLVLTRQLHVSDINQIIIMQLAYIKLLSIRFCEIESMHCNYMYLSINSFLASSSSSSSSVQYYNYNYDDDVDDDDDYYYYYYYYNYH